MVTHPAALRNFTWENHCGGLFELPVAEDGELRIDLKGELAGILAMSSGGKNPAAAMRGGLEQIKVVAGAGFEPATFRL